MKHFALICVLCGSALNLSAQTILTAAGLATFGTNAPAGGGGGGTAFIISGQGAARGSFDGIVGFKFTANANITLTSLGRLVLSGNTGTHRIYLLDATGTEITHADVPTSGITANTYNYVSVTPTALVNGTTYYVVSAETSAGDQWAGDAAVTTTADGTITEDSFSVNPPPTSFGTETSGSHSWVNPNFLYTKP